MGTVETTVNLLPLLGILVIVIGFVLRFNAALVVIVAAFVTGSLASMSPDVLLTKIGEGFMKTRMLPLIIVLPLAVIGLLERNGLKEHAQNWIGKIRSATAGRLLTVYLLVREVAAALGLTSLGGHPQMVRPLVAPMAEGATANQYAQDLKNKNGELPEEIRVKLRAMSAATDNVGLFFGEDVFVAFGAIVLMQTFMKTSANLELEPMHIALWGLPTAISAFIIHAIRLNRLDKQIAQLMKNYQSNQLNQSNQNN